MSLKQKTMSRVLLVVAGSAALTLAASGSTFADSVSSPASDPNSGQYNCVSQPPGSAFPAGSSFVLQATFPGSTVDPGETISYGLIYAGAAFTGDWTFNVALPDGTIGVGTASGVTVPAGGPIAPVSYTVPNSAPGNSTLSAYIINVSVINSANGIGVQCGSNGTPSQVDLTVAPPPTTAPPTTAPPTTEPPTTEPPTTEPPTTTPTTTTPTGVAPGDGDNTTPTAAPSLPATGSWSAGMTGSVIGGLMALLLGALAIRVARRDPANVSS